MTGPNPLLDFQGRITIPPVQFFVLATWHHLAADPNSAGPGTATTPSTADMVRVASLHPLELHQFGAELCEWILEDDFGVRREVESGRGLPRAVGYHDLTIMNPGQLGRLEEGPEVTYSRTAWRSKGRDAVFRAVDHVLTELIVRYWTHRGGFLSKHMKASKGCVTLTLHGDAEPWEVSDSKIREDVQCYGTAWRRSLEHYGGLLEIAVAAFSGDDSGDDLRRTLLLSEDIVAVLRRLKSPLTEPVLGRSHLMPYCSEVSHARNVRRQHAFWDEVEGEERNLWGFISTAYMSLRLHNPALEAGLSTLPVVDRPI